MEYNTQEERLIVKGSERITRDLQVNHNIYVNQGINAKDAYIQNNLTANNLTVSTGNIENISTNNLNVVDLMLSGNISTNGTNGNNDQVLGIVNGKPEWMNIPDQINEDNFVVNNISISNHAILNGFNITAMTVMTEDDYNNVKVKNKSLLYFTTPNGNLYLNRIYSLSLSEPSVTNYLEYAGIYGVKENDEWNNSHSIGLNTAGSVWKTNADYLYVYDASNMYSNSNNLTDTFIINHNLISGDNNYDPMQYCVNMCSTFANCSYFNKPVSIPNNVTCLRNTFDACYNFNQPLTIPGGVTDTTGMLWHCENFNQPVTFLNGITDIHAVFSYCYNFNQPVSFPESTINLVSVFSHCGRFNQPVTIPNNVTNMSGMFYSCTSFNQPVTIPNNVTNMALMFYDCLNFNQSISIPENVSNLSYTFSDCDKLKKSSVPIHISHNIILGDTSNYIYNALVNGLTRITFDPSRILNDA